MTSQSPAFTDSPTQHPNLFLGALQVLFWLFFHPSAWRNHVARIDPDLRPDFCLAELTQAQWRNPALRRLLMGYLIWPFLSAAPVGFIWWTRGASPVSLLILMGVSVVFGVTTSLTVAISVGLAIGIPLCLVMGIAAGLAATNVGGVLVFSIIVFIVATGIARVAANQQGTYSLARQAGSVVVGIVIGLGVMIIAAGVSVGAIAGLAALLPQWAFNGLIAAIAGGVAGGMAFQVRVHRWRQGAFLGVVVGLTFGMATGFPLRAGTAMASGILTSLLISAMFSLPYLLAERIGGVWAGAFAGALGGGSIGLAFIRIGESLPITLAGLISLPLVLGLSLFWPVLFYPLFTGWNLLLFRLDERRPVNRPGLLRWHSAFWDEYQRVPLIGLDEHLVLTLERRSDEGRAAVDYLSATRQRWAAQAAQIEMDARGLERGADVSAIRNAHRSLAAGELEGPASALLRSFSRLSQDADAALQQESAYNQRLALSAVEDRLDGLLRELTRSSEKYAVRFRPVASRWREIVAAHIRGLAEAVEQRQEIDSPYVIGVPLTEQQEIFVGRAGISARIEQLLLDRRRPPLLLYGQRRMGKTSLLNNLGRLLPSTLIPMFVDLQGPASRASDHVGFLYNMARGLIDSAAKQRGLTLPPLARETLAGDPFTHFDEWLDGVEKTLGDNTALLTLDEFEVLESAFAEGRFSETAVLGMLRHLIQHRPRFKVLLAGSHTLDEVQRWASYLINVQVVQIGYLEETEARLLIEQPVKGFALRYEPEASQRAFALTRGHPFLTQLLCAEIVALKNEQDPSVRRLAKLTDVEAAVPEALTSGSFFFADIERNQVDGAGLKLLRMLAGRGEGAVMAQGEVSAYPSESLAALARRDLIESTDGGYRFQVELIRRWFER
jgi:hypothetical protein